MTKVPRSLFSLLVIFFLCWPLAADCHAAPGYRVALPIGRLELPPEARIIELDLPSLLQQIKNNRDLEDLLRLLRQYNDGSRVFVLLNCLQSPQGKDLLSALNLYQVSLYDGEHNHIAWVATIKDHPGLEKLQPGFFQGRLTSGKKQALAAWQAEQKAYLSGKQVGFRKLDFTGPPRKTGYSRAQTPTVNYLEWPDIEHIKINGRRALASSLRVAGQVDGVFSPLYNKTYVFSRGGLANALCLFTLDGERAFWTPIFDQIMTNGFRPAVYREAAQ